jgi:N-methylhydantoinase A
MPTRDFIIFDMGGTTAKASIIENGQPALVTEYEFRDGMSSPSRFVKGGGYMLKVPAIDIAEIGAGGGSMVRIDEGGLLHVGPASAGADPGPACYGLGNSCPTVTDANMALGYLNPVSLAGGTLKVNRSLSEQAIDRIVARPLGISRLEAAHGVRQIANVNMARAIRSVTVERGKDPRDMTMIAFGGNGPLHGVDVARLLGIKQMIVPILSGVFAAAGMLSADVEHNFVHASPRKLSDVTERWLFDQVKELERQGREALSLEGYDAASSHFAFFADLRYVGQSSELSISFDCAQLDSAIARFGDRFRTEHEATYGYSTDEPVELANIRLTAIGRSDHRLRFSDASIRHEEEFVHAEKRSASLIREGGFCDIPLLDRKTVGREPAPGPAIIESYDTTILVPEGCLYRADAIGNIIVDIDA